MKFSPLATDRRGYLGFAIISILVSAATISAQDFTAENLLQSSIEQIGPQHRDVASAIEEFKKGQFLECRNKLKSARQADPALPPDGILMAQMLFAAKQQGLARAEIERVASEEPTDPESYLLLGEIGFQQRRYTEAQLSFIRGAELTQKYTGNDFRKRNLIKRARSGLAGIAEAKKEWSTAAKYLKPLVDANPADANVATRLARAVFNQDTNVGDNQGQETDAAKILAALYKSNPTKVLRPEITLAQMYQVAGELDRSASLMKSASTKDEQGLATQLTVARWALRTGDLPLAEQCSNRALQIESGSMDARLVAGLTARYKKDYKRARQILEAAHLQSPGNLSAIVQLAVVLVEGSAADQRTALEYSSLANRMYPDMGEPAGREAAVTSAWIYYRQGRQREANLVLQKALAGGGVSAETSYYAAEIIHQSNPEIAKQLLSTALKGDGVFPARNAAEELLKRLGG